MDEVSDPAISVLAEGLFLFLSFSFIPVKIYGNADVQKLAIYQENKDKSGVYL
jgi:hypothetical protein